MEPNETLRQIRELIVANINKSDVMGRFAGLVDALDTWLVNGGAKPSAWGGDDPASDVPAIRAAWQSQHREGAIFHATHTRDGWVVWVWHDEHGCAVAAPTNGDCELHPIEADPDPAAKGGWAFAL